MKYELAKELKDAGFPTKVMGLWMTADNSEPRIIPANIQQGDIIKIEHRNEAVYVPTLEELIEACGTPFEIFDKGKFGWAARHDTRTCECGKVSKESWGEGSTPTEAVANLWLALNKKV